MPPRATQNRDRKMKQNRNLNPVELERANSVLGEVRTRLKCTCRR